MNQRLGPNAGGGRRVGQPNAGYNAIPASSPAPITGATTTTRGIAGFLGLNFQNPNEAAAYGNNKGLLALTQLGRTVTGVQQVAAQVKYGGRQIANQLNGGDYQPVNLDAGGRSIPTPLLIGGGLVGVFLLYKLIR